MSDTEAAPFYLDGHVWYGVKSFDNNCNNLKEALPMPRRVHLFNWQKHILLSEHEAHGPAWLNTFTADEQYRTSLVERLWTSSEIKSEAALAWFMEKLEGFIREPKPQDWGKYRGMVLKYPPPAPALPQHPTLAEELAAVGASNLSPTLLPAHLPPPPPPSMTSNGPLIDLMQPAYKTGPKAPALRPLPSYAGGTRADLPGAAGAGASARAKPEEEDPSSASESDTVSFQTCIRPAATNLASRQSSSASAPAPRAPGSHSQDIVAELARMLADLDMAKEKREKAEKKQKKKGVLRARDEMGWGS